MQGRQVDRNGAQSRHYVLPPNKTRCSCSFALRIDIRGKNTCTLSGDINITLTYQSDFKAWLSSSLDHLNIDKKISDKKVLFHYLKKDHGLQKVSCSHLGIYGLSYRSISFLDAFSDAKTLCLSSEEMLVFSRVTFRMAPPLFHSFLQKGIYQ